MIKNAVLLLLTLVTALMLLSGCATSFDEKIPIIEMAEAHESDLEATLGGANVEVDYSIDDKYACTNDYFEADFFIQHPEAVPFIDFVEDGKCIFGINYSGGFCDVNGTYSIEDDRIYVELDFKGTIFIDNETAATYTFTQYVFSIVSDDEIVIDKDCYGVRAGDSFIREPNEDGSYGLTEHSVLKQGEPGLEKWNYGVI